MPVGAVDCFRGEVRPPVEFVYQFRRIFSGTGSKARGGMMNELTQERVPGKTNPRNRRGAFPDVPPAGSVAAE